MWLNVDQLGSGHGTPVALSSGSELSSKPGRSERRTGSLAWLPSLPECCRVDQCGSVSTVSASQLVKITSKDQEQLHTETHRGPRLIDHEKKSKQLVSHTVVYEAQISK